MLDIAESGESVAADQLIPRASCSGVNAKDGKGGIRATSLRSSRILCGLGSSMGQATGYRRSGFPVGLWPLVACLERSGPPPHQKDARFGRLACFFAALQPDAHPANHSNPRRASFLRFDPRCCPSPGRHFCADGLAVGRSRHSFLLNPFFSIRSFFWQMQDARTLLIHQYTYL
ncbi:hypothetical protein VTI28DRAFT_9929 [Corynascus sepedonium]